jgi:hypothetical protein
MSDTRIGGGGTARISVFDIATPRNGGFELALAAQIPAAVLPNVRTRFGRVMDARGEPYTTVNATTTTTPSPRNVLPPLHMIQFFF